MHKLIAIPAIFALALAGGAAAAGETAVEKGEARLAEMLEGRSAGEPVSCFWAMNANGIKVIDQTALVYKAGDTIYVARPVDRKQLRSDDSLTFGRDSKQICSNSFLAVNAGSRINKGRLQLSDFVPYTKTSDAS